MLVQESIIGAREVVLVRTSTIGALGRLCWYRRVLYEHSGGCVDTVEHSGAVLVQQRPIGALGSLCLYSRVL